MAIDPLSSLSSLGSLGAMQAKKPAGSSVQPGGSADFASVLSDLAKQTASTLKSSEDTAIRGIQGKAPVQEVVQSVIHAQTSLQTAIALRDKALSAYQELIRMPI
jgi:flagellar hook-basal body complex protein FliE